MIFIIYFRSLEDVLRQFAKMEYAVSAGMIAETIFLILNKLLYPDQLSTNSFGVLAI